MLKKKKTGNSKDDQENYFTSGTDGGLCSVLLTPNLPFDLDYFEVFQSLMEILVEVYAKLMEWKPRTSSSAAIGTDRSLSREDITPSGQADSAFRDGINRIDSKIMKLISLLMKELDDISVKVTNDCLAEIDPLIFLKKEVEEKADDDDNATETGSSALISTVYE